MTTHPPNSVFVTGGTRSGKTRFAEECAGRRTRTAYLATAEARDEEMAARIERHRQKRSGDWTTLEEPIDVVEVLRNQSNRFEAIIVDCVTLWLSNLMLAGWTDAGVLDEVNRLADWMRSGPCRLICVSNEVGSGVVPATRDGRRFRDLQGAANQMLAAGATEAYCLVAGIPLRLK